MPQTFYSLISRFHMSTLKLLSLTKIKHLPPVFYLTLYVVKSASLVFFLNQLIASVALL